MAAILQNARWRPYWTRGKCKHCFSDCLYHKLSKNVWFSHSPQKSSEISNSNILNLTNNMYSCILSGWPICVDCMGFFWRNDCSPGFFPTHSTLASKLFFLAVQGSGALLSSNFEEALCKSP